MFERVREAFKGIDSLAVDSQGTQVDGDLRLATAVILLEMAQVDGHYTSDEGRSLFLLLEKEFGLTKEKTHALLEKAEINVGGATRLDHFVGIINSHFDELQRQRILADAWKIISADGETSQQESKFAVHLRAKLGLSMEQSLRARKLAEEGVDLGDTSKLIRHTDSEEK
jgi:uncharacterized tellurite resistance protein B-like protein